MVKGLSLSSEGVVRVFPCDYRKGTIDNFAEQCSFYSVKSTMAAVNAPRKPLRGESNLQRLHLSESELWPAFSSLLFLTSFLIGDRGSSGFTGRT